MNLHFIIYAIFIMTAGQGLFISSVLYYKYKNQKPEVKYFSLYLISFSVIIFYWTIFWINNQIGKPLTFINFGEPFVFLLAPSLYFYVTEKKSAFWPHVLPALIPVLMLTPRYLQVYGDITWTWYLDNMTNAYTIWTSLNIIQIAIYYYLIQQYDRSNPVPIEQKFGLAAYGIGLTLYLIFAHTGIIKLYAGIFDYMISGVIVAMIYITSYKSFLVKSLFSSPVNQIELEKGEQIIMKIKEVIEREKCYLNPSFKILDLAEKVDEPRHVISKVLNENYNISFNDFINEYRIRHSEHLLKTTDDKLYAVALDSGFSNKVSFINNFKKIHEMTPAVYRNEYLKSIEEYYPSPVPLTS